MDVIEQTNFARLILGIFYEKFARITIGLPLLSNYVQFEYDALDTLFDNPEQ